MKLRVRLWMKLALLAAGGVVVMHAVHLTLGNRIAGRALRLARRAGLARPDASPFLERHPTRASGGARRQLVARERDLRAR